MRRFLTILAVAASSNAFAQHSGHSAHPPASGYAGMQARDIKALSAEQQAAAYNQARGYAPAAGGAHRH